MLKALRFDELSGFVKIFVIELEAHHESIPSLVAVHHLKPRNGMLGKAYICGLV